MKELERRSFIQEQLGYLYIELSKAKDEDAREFYQAKITAHHNLLEDFTEENINTCFSHN